MSQLITPAVANRAIATHNAEYPIAVQTAEASLKVSNIYEKEAQQSPIKGMVVASPLENLSLHIDFVGSLKDTSASIDLYVGNHKMINGIEGTLRYTANEHGPVVEYDTWIRDVSIVTPDTEGLYPIKLASEVIGYLNVV